MITPAASSTHRRAYGQGDSEINNWLYFWRRRLQQRVPPVGIDCAYHAWITAENRACAGDYDGLREALFRVV